MENHPVSDLFPLMPADELRALAEDIKTNGLLFPIVILDDMVLDGRNRLAACESTGVEPRFETFAGDDPLAYVVSSNLLRRHLGYDQRVGLALKLLPNLELEAAKRERASTKMDPVAISQQGWTGGSAARAAELTHTGARQVAALAPLARKNPKLPDDLLAGRTTVAKVRKKVRREALKKQKDDIDAGRVVLPPGVFQVIVVDPPWPYGTEYNPDGRRAASPYPEMSLAEIGNLKLPADDNCVLWLWTTHAFMRASFPILDQWGFREVAILTWKKNRMGLGSWLRSQTEFCVMAVKGHPKVLLSKQTTIIEAPVREHSRKPDGFYHLVESLCIGRRLDFFSREPRDGWEQFGSETAKFSDVATASNSEEGRDS